jgi:hypothetical protein
MTHGYRKHAILAVVSMFLALGTGIGRRPGRPEAPPPGRAGRPRRPAPRPCRRCPPVHPGHRGPGRGRDVPERPRPLCLVLIRAAVVDQTAATLTERINQAVANGRLTQETGRRHPRHPGCRPDRSDARPVPAPPLASRLDPERIRQLGEQGLIGAPHPTRPASAQPTCWPRPARMTSRPWPKSRLQRHRRRRRDRRRRGQPRPNASNAPSPTAP